LPRKREDIDIIFFDLDSTIIDCESLDEIAKAIGKDFENITKEGMEGKISFEKSIKKRAELLKNVKIKEIEKAIERIPIMRGAKETISLLKKAGYKVVLITGGFTVVTDRINKELDFDLIIANRLIVKNGSIVDVEGPIMSDNSKAKEAEKVSKLFSIPLDRCAAVGDGANDRAIFNKVKLKVAFNPKPILEPIADYIIKDRDLRRILPIFLKDDCNGNREA